MVIGSSLSINNTYTNLVVPYWQTLPVLAHAAF
jgi:hypothetical protein